MVSDCNSGNNGQVCFRSITFGWPIFSYIIKGTVIEYFHSIRTTFIAVLKSMAINPKSVFVITKQIEYSITLNF